MLRQLLATRFHIFQTTLAAVRMEYALLAKRSSQLLMTGGVQKSSTVVNYYFFVLKCRILVITVYASYFLMLLSDTVFPQVLRSFLVFLCSLDYVCCLNIQLTEHIFAVLSNALKYVAIVYMYIPS